MSLYTVKSEELTAMADAIRTKTGGTSPILFAADTGFASAIEEIPSGGGGGSTNNGVIFIDYDGSTVESWAADDVASKTALPELPDENPRLVPGEWNWSLANIKSYIADYPEALVVVGHNPTTASGFTEMDITLTKVTGLTVTCNMVGNKNWGDGTTDALTSHTYTDYGDYTITCDGTSIPAGSSSSNGLFGATSSNVNRFWCTAIRIGESVTSIGDYAFSNCYSLTRITIPAGVTSIGESAFNACYSLTNITIPDGVIEIYGSTFYNCYSLTSIAIPNSVDTIRGAAFYNCYSLASITIPNSAVTIGNSAFYNCYSLASITIPSGVTSVGTIMFQNCYSLASVTISAGVTSISNTMFQNCYSLASITIPDTVTSIGNNTFNSCYSLANITIPSGIASVGDSSFSKCTSITKYDFTASTAVPTLSSTYAFTNINGICKIIVPDALYDTWIAATNWATYANYIYKASEVTD